MTLKVIQGHMRPPLCQNHTSTFVYGSILMKICMNAYIILSNCKCSETGRLHAFSVRIQTLPLLRGKQKHCYCYFHTP